MTEALMTWDDVLADPCLQNLPYKNERNGEGNTVMSPAGNQHGRRQMQVGAGLAAHGGGTAWVEGSVQVADGSVYVADVVCMSDARMAQDSTPDPMLVVPDICVEVVAPPNSKKELPPKIAAYPQTGGLEVWFVTRDGQGTVHTESTH